ncbi:MAG: DUF6786 family protein [Planctomycetota bacterium]
MIHDRTRILTDAGKPVETFTMPDGTRLLLLPYGARTLGLYAPASDESFYWVNPCLEQVDTAGALFAGSVWHNTGGDRTWLAPELDIFFPDAKAERYVQPRELDMSDYAVERVGGGIQMSRAMMLHLARPGRDVRLELGKWLGPAANPLRHNREMEPLLRGVEFAGYTQRTTLKLPGEWADRLPQLGIWNLIQLPPGGELLVPTYSRVTPQVCFGGIPPQCLQIEDRLLRLAVSFSGSHKISLRGSAVCGRAGYVYAQDDRYALVLRNFFVDPSGEYIDVQKSDPGDLGYCLQVCRVDEPEFGSFFELEYHAPAIGAPPLPSRSEDVSQVWAFRGAREAIDPIARRLLGAGISDHIGP